MPTMTLPGGRPARSPGARWALALLAVAAAVAAGCGPGLVATDRIVPVRLDGRPIDVVLAGPDGMRGRDFGRADAMLFSWPDEQDPTAVRFVMDGVAMPLDLAVFDGEGRWLGTTRMEPCQAQPCPVTTGQAPFRWALEAPAGGILMELGADARLEVPAP